MDNGLVVFIMIYLIVILFFCLAYYLNKYNSKTDCLEAKHKRFVSEEVFSRPYKVREFYNNALAEGKIDIEEYSTRMQKLEKQNLEVWEESKRQRKVINKRRGFE